MKKYSFLHTKKITLCFFSFLLYCLICLSAAGCHQKVDYFDYVSELRSNIFIAKIDKFSLRIYAVEKETPYVTDGIPKEVTMRTEVYLAAPAGNKPCELSFSVNEKDYGGEMSFDNVKGEYYFSCSLDVSSLQAIPCQIEYGEETVTLQATSVREATTLTPSAVLSALIEKEKDLFTALTDKYGFSGEIYIRLIYEETAYYYVGIIDRTGAVNAFLINAKNGKILAKRQS